MSKKVLLLKTVTAEMTAHNGFVYPAKGKVVAPDWDPSPTCGGGIHGLLWGEGNGNLLPWEPGAKWLVLEAKAKHVVDLSGKVKVPKARVVHCGDQQSATQYLLTHGAERRAVAGASVTAGDDSTAMAGDYGKAQTGKYGKATAGDDSTAMAGDYGTAQAGHYGKAQAGECGTATAGDYGTARAGYRGTAQAGYRGTAQAGYRGTAQAGDYGTAQAGKYGKAQVGHQGTATAGDHGRISIEWHDGKRLRLVTGYIGEDNLLPGTPYRLDARGNFIKATEE